MENSYMQKAENIFSHTVHCIKRLAEYGTMPPLKENQAYLGRYQDFLVILLKKVGGNTSTLATRQGWQEILDILENHILKDATAVNLYIVTCALNRFCECCMKKGNIITFPNSKEHQMSLCEVFQTAPVGGRIDVLLKEILEGEYSGMYFRDTESLHKGIHNSNLTGLFKNGGEIHHDNIKYLACAESSVFQLQTSEIIQYVDRLTNLILIRNYLIKQNI